MTDLCRRYLSRSPEETGDLARAIAARLRPGDTILLDGPVGAGKTHFARCLIQSLLDVPEDVPSPTFTLVQTYDTSSGEVWHADLYRLGHPEEVVELGLEEAFESAICLVEWPDRLGELTPAGALHMTFAAQGETARAITAEGPARWAGILPEGTR